MTERNYRVYVDKDGIIRPMEEPLDLLTRVALELFGRWHRGNPVDSALHATNCFQCAREFLRVRDAELVKEAE